MQGVFRKKAASLAALRALNETFGLVTDSGGILSHAAMIAREYRIPALVAAGNATALLHSGQHVRVDGSNGLVEVL